jgi:hypothetical protein
MAPPAGFTRVAPAPAGEGATRDSDEATRWGEAPEAARPATSSLVLTAAIGAATAGGRTSGSGVRGSLT